MKPNFFGIGFNFNKIIKKASGDKVNEEKPNKSNIVNTKIDSAREKINSDNPISALNDLEKIKAEEWSTATKDIKFRIVTNIAAAEAKINKEDEASKHFIEALQYNPDDEKALCNAATGYLIQDNKPEAAKIIERILELNPASDRGYSLKIYVTKDDADFDKVIESIPEINRKSSMVSHAMGHVMRQKGNYKDSMRWFRNAVKADPDDIEKQTALAETILQTVIENQAFIYGEQLSDDVKDDLEKADKIFQTAWSKVSDKDIKKFRTSWLGNRSLANRLLKKDDIAMQTINEALEINEKDPEHIKQKSILLFETDKRKEATALLKTIDGYDSQPKIAIPLAALLRENGQFEETINLLKKLQKNTEDEDAIFESNRMLIDLYIQVKQHNKAIKLSDHLIKSDPDNISYYIDKSHIYHALNKIEVAISYLEQAKDKISDGISNRQQIELGSAFYILEKYHDAANILENIADISVDSEITRKLLNSYYRSGKLREALKVIKSLRASKKKSKYFTEMESSIYEGIDDWDNAKKVCQRYLAVCPDDQEIQIRYAVVLYRSGSKSDLKKLDAFLDKNVDTLKLSFNFWMQLINLYESRNQTSKALHHSYEVRRKFFDIPEAHLQYVGLFFRTEKTNEVSFDHGEVQFDSAVCVEDGGSPWYIIEERENPDLSKGEINKDHSLFNILFGKKVGDIVTLKDTGPAPEKVKIKEIKSRFVYALHDSLNNFSGRFPTATGLWGVKVQSTTQKEKNGTPPKDLQVILDQISKHDDYIKRIEEFYKDGKLTIGAVSKLVGRDILVTWGGLISRASTGLRVSNGTLEERKAPVLALRADAKPRLVIDPVSLMTIHGIDIADDIVDHFGKLIVLSSTLELFKTNMAEKSGLGSRGYMTIAKEGDKFVRNEITKEQIKKNIEYIKSIIEWIEKRCDVLPCTPALDIDRDIKIKDEHLLGKESHDTIVMASQPDNILFSDDERLRSLADHSYGCVGVWTQLLMMELLDKKVITGEKYAKGVLKLLNSNYHHTSISKEVLVEAAKESSWKIEEPLTGIIGMLKNGRSDLPSAVSVGAEFIRQIWDSGLEIDEKKRTVITKHIISMLVENRSLTKVVELIKNNLDRLFLDYPLGKEKVLSVIRSWGKNQGFDDEI